MRSKEEIARFTSDLFYDGRIRTNPNAPIPTETRITKAIVEVLAHDSFFKGAFRSVSKRTFIWVDVKLTEQTHQATRFSYYPEGARQCCLLADGLLYNPNIAGTDVMSISHYSADIPDLRRQMDQFDQDKTEGFGWRR
jgi:hypothetical protein